MALTKDQLRLENDQNFPNNNTGFITAEGLRGFNDDMITSLSTQAEIDSLDDRVTANSESIELLSESFENFSSSLLTDFASQADFAAFTQSVNEDSASDSTRLTNLEDYSSSFNTSTLVTTASFNAYTASTDNRVDALEQASASLELFSGSINTYTGSNDARVQSLETETGSLQSQINNISGVTGSYATTGSNTFVGNQIVRGDLFVDGDLTARTLYIDSSSILYTSGSNKFGDSLDDTQEFTGSVTITGSLEAPLGEDFLSSNFLIF